MVLFQRSTISWKKWFGPGGQSCPSCGWTLGPQVEQSNVFGGGFSLREWRFERSNLISLPWKRLCVHVRLKVVIGAHIISAEQFFSFVSEGSLEGLNVSRTSKYLFILFISAQPLDIMSVHCLCFGTCCTKNDLIVKSWMKWRWLRPHPKWVYSTSQTSNVDIATTRTDPFYIFLWARADLTTHPMFWDSFHQLQGFFIIYYRRNVVPQDFLQGIMDCCFCFLDSCFVQLAVHEVPNWMPSFVSRKPWQQIAQGLFHISEVISILYINDI